MGEQLTLADVCSQIIDCEHKTAPAAPRGTEYGYSVGTPCIRNGRLFLDAAKRVDRATYEKWTARAVPQKNDIILTREAPVGEAALLDGNSRVCLGQRTVLLRPDSRKINPRFLHYFLLSPAMQERMRTRAEGSTVPHLNVGDIRNLGLGELPPLREQHVIAAVLGALDDKIAVNERIATTVDRLAEAEYVRSTGKATETVLLGDLLDLKYGKALPATSRSPGDVPVYGSGGIVGTHNQHLVDGPGIVVGRKGTVGAVYWSQQKFFPIDTTFYVEVRRPDVPMEFLFFMLRRLGLDSMNSDSAVPGLNRANALALKTQLPPQDELVRFANKIRPLFELKHSLSVQSNCLKELRDTLLPKLISGELRVRDAEKAVEEAL
ncbi:restriction endonuclease [Carbonactinospora thermoautotrophica]|uniref:restriction endonuclease subunit S n=1 Tax=Carbonactinospora thermoautotrophica TaxID=1469144 RepID=UPI00226E437D|nr:restriction endonuclease subunit S [Carbonactinospora thermoautotrophica]MCX9193453.1 restriction endonuclease [Carbonactinospora thermoautotrophica]